MVVPKKSFQELQEESHSTINMHQNNDNVVITVNLLPTVDSNDVRVEIEDGQLHIFSGHKEKEGFFDRLVSLPANINSFGMSYDINGGVLTVIIPKQ